MLSIVQPQLTLRNGQLQISYLPPDTRARHQKINFRSISLHHQQEQFNFMSYMVKIFLVKIIFEYASSAASCHYGMGTIAQFEKLMTHGVMDKANEVSRGSKAIKTVSHKYVSFLVAQVYV